jgi:hypothetical protein
LKAVESLLAQDGWADFFTSMQFRIRTIERRLSDIGASSGEGSGLYVSVSHECLQDCFSKYMMADPRDYDGYESCVANCQALRGVPSTP